MSDFFPKEISNRLRLLPVRYGEPRVLTFRNNLSDSVEIGKIKVCVPEMCFLHFFFETTSYKNDGTKLWSYYNIKVCTDIRAPAAHVDYFAEHHGDSRKWVTNAIRSVTRFIDPDIHAAFRYFGTNDPSIDMNPELDFPRKSYTPHPSELARKVITDNLDFISKEFARLDAKGRSR